MWQHHAFGHDKRQLQLPRSLAIVTSILCGGRSGLGGIGGVSYAERPSSSSGGPLVRPRDLDEFTSVSLGSSDGNSPKSMTLASKTRDLRWTHNYGMEQGASILETSHKMLKPNPPKKARYKSIAWDSDLNQAYWDSAQVDGMSGPFLGYRNLNSLAEDSQRKSLAVVNGLQKLVDKGQKAFNKSNAYNQRIANHFKMEGGIAPLVSLYRQGAAKITEKDIRKVETVLDQGKPDLPDGWRALIPREFKVGHAEFDRKQALFDPFPYVAVHAVPQSTIESASVADSTAATTQRVEDQLNALEGEVSQLEHSLPHDRAG